MHTRLDIEIMLIIKRCITTKQILSQLCNPHHLMHTRLILVVNGIENPFTINRILFFYSWRFQHFLIHRMLTIFIVIINRDILSENENNCSLTSSMVIEKRIFSKSYYDRAACLACWSFKASRPFYTRPHCTKENILFVKVILRLSYLSVHFLLVSKM